MKNSIRKMDQKGYPNGNKRPKQLPLNILHRHSINSLLKQNNVLSCDDVGETMSISDLLGLNSPRGLLNFGSSDKLFPCTPPASPHNMQEFLASEGPLVWLAQAPATSQNTKNNLDVNQCGVKKGQLTHANFEDGMLHSGPHNSYGNAGASVKNLQRNISLGSAGSSPATPTYLSRTLRSVSVSDSCGSNSPAVMDQTMLNRSNSRSNSPESYFAPSLNSPDITELLNSLTLNENLSRNLFGGNTSPDLDLSNLQNLQAVHALKYLQQPPALLSSLFPNASNYNSPLLDKWTHCSSSNLVSESHQLDRAARFHRSAASVYDAVCTWSGVLPQRTEKPVGYSSKVFLGGVPWDISEQYLIQTFKQFGSIKVEWPGKDREAPQPKGYVYIIFESEKSVKALLQACTHEYVNNVIVNSYFKIGSKRMKSKDVQVIPWYLSDSNYTKSASQKLDPSKTVFVGALHGMLNAQGLAKIMNDLFDGVVYAGIDTDKYKYPIGSGRVTFNNPRSYMKAVSAAFIEIKTTKFTKKVQVDPYLEDALCSFCGVQQGPYFCRDISCFRYYCRSCWTYQHGSELRHHNPMSRNSKNRQVL